MIGSFGKDVGCKFWSGFLVYKVERLYVVMMKHSNILCFFAEKLRVSELAIIYRKKSVSGRSRI